MADKSISQLVSATSLLSTDIFPVVTNAETKKVTMAVLCENMPTANVHGMFKLSGAVSNITSGEINVDNPVSTLENQTGNVLSLTLPNGSFGMMKVLIAETLTNTITVNVTNGNNLPSVSFTESGQSAILFYTTHWTLLSKT